MANTKQLQDFEALATQVITALTQGRPVTVASSELNNAAIDAAAKIINSEIRRRKTNGRKKLKGEVSPGTAKLRRYRKTGSTIGWEEELNS